MARNPIYQLTFSTLDQSGEIGTHMLQTADLLAVNPVPAAVTAYLTALEGITNGLNVRWASQGIRRLSNAEYASDGNREDKFLITYSDNTTLAVYQTEIPCRDNDIPLLAGTDRLDLDQLEVAAYKTAFEALARSPDGNAVTLLAIQLVGRNV